MSLAIPLQLDNATAQELVTFYALKVFRLEMALASSEIRLAAVANELLDARRTIERMQQSSGMVQPQAESYGGSAA